MDGLDQTSTAGAPAALPRVGRTIIHHPHACGVRAATSWGARELHHFEAEELLQLDAGTARDVYCAVLTCPVCCGCVFVEKTCPPIRDNAVLNALSRLRPG